MSARDFKTGPAQRFDLQSDSVGPVQQRTHHNPRAQLRQNAAFMAQMKAVQRKELNDSGKRWNMQGQDRKFFRTGRVSDPKFTCAILRFVWPGRGISDEFCQKAGAQKLAGYCLRDLIFGSEFMDVIPRPAVPTPGWVMGQIKDAFARDILDRGVYNTILGAIAYSYGAMLEDLMASGHYTTEHRGLGF